MYKRVLLYPLLMILSWIGTVCAQVDTVRIGVNGLTCSSCSKTVEEQMMKLSFVRSVHMNLNSNDAIVVVDYSKQADWNKLAKSVFDAGFSIGYFQVPSCIKMEEQFAGISCAEAYVYLGAVDKQAGHGYYYTLIGKHFMTPKEYSHWKNTLKGMTYIPTAKPVYYYY